MYRQFFLFILFCLVFSPTGAFAESLSERVHEHQLENGLTVLLVERHNSPTVAAYISFRVGAVNENSEERGIAHMLEHMLFKGTETLGTRDFKAELPLLQQIEETGAQLDLLKSQADADVEELQRLHTRLDQLQLEHREWVVKDEFSRIYAEQGGVGYNAFTSKDQTSYLINLPANKLELWAAIESDRLRNAVFREFFTEREVVQEERRRAVDVNPGGKLYENMLATAFQVHPYRHPIIGWDSDIQGFSLPKIREFFSAYYAPANMIITLVGAIDQDDTLAMINDYFGDLPPGTKVPAVTDREPPQRGERRIHVDFDAQPRLMIAYHKPTLPHPDDYSFDLLASVLTQGRTSRLYQSLVVEQQLVTDVGVFTAPGSRYDNLLVFTLLPRNGVSLMAVETALENELQRLLSDPLSSAEIDKARRQITTSLLRGIRTNSGLARTLSIYQVIGDWKYLVTYEDRLNSVTPDDLKRVVTTYLHNANRTVATLSRGGEE
jgi:predicted Zn-dependent peptidase